MDEDRRDDAGTSDFDARLRQARDKAGLDAKPAANPSGSGSNAGSALGVGLRVGVELVSALIVAVGIGWALDHWLHTLPLFLIIFVLLGGVAGVLNVWRVIGPRR